MWPRGVRPAPIVFTERWVAPRSRHSRARFAHAVEGVARLVTGLKLGEPAVGDLGDPLEHGLGHAAHPYRNGALDGERVDASSVEVMIRALESHHRLGPELPHDGDLLADAAAPRVKVLVQGLVLDMVPADAHAEAQAPAGEDVHRRSLLGHEGSLPLGQDDDAGDELEAPRARAQVTEQNEDLVEGALVGVRRAATERVEALRLAAQHVVEDEQVVVTGTLGRLGVVADDRGVRADLRLGKYHAEFHVVFVLHRRFASCIRIAEVTALSCRRADESRFAQVVDEAREVGYCAAMALWLLKSEPDEWSWTEQVAKGRDGAEWTGIRNFSARNHLRAMKKGEQAFFYHTGKERAIVGIVKVIGEAHPDSTDSAWSAVNVAALRPLPTPVGLDQIKANQRLAGMALVRLARLSVQPVSEAEWRTICQMGGLG